MTKNGADIGLIGLAVMGQNLVMNMNDHGFKVVVFNRTVSKVDDFLKGSAIKVIPENVYKKKSKHRCILIKSRFLNKRLDSSTYRFRKNNIVLLKKRLTPKGTTLKGPISRNVRRKKFLSSFAKSI